MRPAGAALALLLAAVAASPAADGPSAPKAGFIGAAACVECHARETAEWRKSAHGRPGVPENGVGARWMQAYIRRAEDGHHRIEPKCKDLRTGEMCDVPGVLERIRGDPTGWPAPAPIDVETRSFETDCSGCHSSRPWFTTDPATRKLVSSWDDLAIDCEACHGPGAEHVDTWKRLDGGRPMARLEKMSPREATAVCARCHGGPPTDREFSPADATHFVTDLDDRIGFFANGVASGQIYQYPGFVRSRCFREGGLTCSGCHESHGPALRPAAHPDALCTRCHTDKSGREHTFHDPRGTGARCVECHMPRLLPGIMSHQRDHTIGNPLPAADPPDACTACHKDKDKKWSDAAYRKWWGDPPQATLDAIRAIALARLGDPAAAPLLREARTHPDPFFRANAALYLGDATLALGDPVPEVRLAGVRAASHALLRKAVEDPEPRVRVAAMLRRLEMGIEIPPTARGDLEIVTRQVRDLSRGNVVLGVMQIHEGLFEEAARSFQRALGFDPEMGEAWVGLETAGKGVR